MWTTIDRRIQQAAETALGARAGAVVVMDPRNGDVLALASHPAFPVERFARPLDRETWLALVQDPARPLLNRAVQGVYPPGSLFKIVVAAAALQAQVITPVRPAVVPPAVGVRRTAVPQLGGPRSRGADAPEALQFSCNTFFYQLGSEAGTREDRPDGGGVRTRAG